MFNLVFESNPARSLYERLGFSAIGRVPDAVGDEAGRYLNNLLRPNPLPDPYCLGRIP